MAARADRTLALALLFALTVWTWALAYGLYTLRWSSVVRPLPPAREALLYGELRVGIDPSAPPFAAYAADGVLFGFDVELGQALGERLNIPVTFVPLGYDGLYDALRVDRVDIVIASLLIDPQRSSEVRYTTPYFNAGLTLVSAAAFGADAMSDVSGRRLALEFGSQADAEARLWLRRVLSFETRPYEISRHALDAVRVGDADAALVDAVTARLYLRAYPTWAAHTATIRDAWYAIGVRADRDTTWAAVNAALASLAADGTLDALIARWL